jgi:hypothetical protein
MKRHNALYVARLLFLANILASTACHAANRVAPYFSIRSQGFNAARKYMGITNAINLDQDSLYGTLWTTIDYTRSFHSHRIAQSLFGDVLLCKKDCSCIQIAGSQVADRTQKDLLADYFGLPLDFKSRVCFNPHIDNLIFDFNMYLGLDEHIPGTYFSIQAPLVHTRWNLDMHETVITPGSQGYPAGYFGPLALAANKLLDNFTEFVSGSRAPIILDCAATDPMQPRIVFKELSNAKMDTRRHYKTRIAELTFTAGWNFLRDEDERYHAGFALRTSAPCGNKPKGEFLFEPIVGNGHHWEFGGEANGHYSWLLSDNRSLSIFGDIVFVHLFKAHQHRTYDLRGKPLSRYMLAQKIGDNTKSDPRLNPDIFPSIEFANVFMPIANLSTIDVDVSVGLQADCLAMFTYQHDRVTWDLGYSFWGRSCETIALTCAFASQLEQMPNTWALKGDAFVIGFENNAPDFSPVRLAATESDATVQHGTNVPAATAFSNWDTNPGIDNPTLATSNHNRTVLAQRHAGAPQTRSSAPAKLLNPTDINLNNASTRGSSHKIFTNIQYTWSDKPEWIPFIGIGGQAEFGTSDRKSACSCKKRCCACLNTSLSQWSFWVKGGMSF